MANQDKKALYRLTYRVDGKVCFAEMFAKGARLRNLYTPSKVAHIFEGWQSLPERMPDSDLVIDGTFRPMSFKLTFTVGGETVEERELPYGAAIEAPTVPEKDGYAFSGWEDLPETMPAEDLTVVGRYLRDSYRLTYVVGGKHRFTVHLPYGAKIEPLQSPVKDEHVFSGWENLPETMPDADIVVNGSFEMKTFRLTRIVDGEVFMAEDLPIGAKIDKKVKPVKPGFYFSGWRKLPDTMPDHDITAITSMYPVRYRVDYEIDGEAWRTTYVPYTSEFEPEMPEDREGYVFRWLDAPATMPMQDIVVHGEYAEGEAPAEVPAPASYTARFLLDGELLLELTLEEGAAITAPEAPEKLGHIFVGFGEVPATMPAEDLSFDGRYTPNEYTLSFLADGELISRETLTYGAAIKAPELAPRAGYTFSGWEIPETMPAEDLVLEGSYAAAEYTVRFLIDGETVSEQTLLCGAPIFAPEAPLREGFTFAGWGALPETMPAEDLILEGSYTAELYLASFSVDGVTVFEEMLPFGAAVTVPEVESRIGYSFLGFGDVPATMPAAAFKAEGSYAPNSYTVSFSVDGETVFSESLVYGSAIAVPEVAAREGYLFSGFGDVPATVPACDLAFEGGFTAIEYRLSFTIEGEEIAAEMIPFGSAITAPEAPERVGFRFLGFGDLPETMPASDLALVGEYEAILYTLSATVDGESVYEAQLAAGAAYELPEMPAREGFVFAWETRAGEMPAADLALSGAYTALSYTLTFAVEGETVAELELPFGAEIILPEMPEKAGFRFLGFADAPATMPAVDLTLTGAYEQTAYTLTFAIDGETVSSESVEVGSAITAPAPENREGMAFAWADLPEVMPAADLTVEGAYTTLSYTLTVSVDGEVLSSETLAYGAAITLPEMPARDGFGFGWSAHPAVMPAADLTVEGGYSTEIYTVTFTVDGKSTFELSLPFGAAIEAPEAPARAGQRFLGWKELPETMPAEDLTVSGSYEAALVALTFTVGGETVAVCELPVGEAPIVPAMPVREGYTFAWADLPEVMPDADMTVEGSYTAEMKRLLCVIDGETVLDTELACGAEIRLPEAEEREGYVFAWSECGETMPAEDLTVEGSYTPAVYTLTFTVDGETVRSEEVAFGAEINAPADPHKEGYIFSGWGTLPETMPASDLLCNATLSRGSYRLTVIAGGETLLDETVLFGDPISVPEAPEREGRDFNGWGDLPETMPAHDLAIVSDYTARLYRLTFILDGIVLSDAEVSYGSPVLAPLTEIGEGRVFSGWGELPAAMPAEDLTVRAESTPAVYHLTYLLNGEAVLEADVAYGDVLPTPADAAEEGYDFSGYEIPETMPAEDLVLSATKSPKLYRLTVKLDGEVLSEDEVAFGSEIAEPAIPEREGCTFSGWGLIPSVMPAEDLVIEGSFHAETYRLAFILDGELLSEEQVAVGAHISAPGLTLGEGRAFSGWGLIPETMPAEDLEFVGNTEATRSFTLRFLHNAKTVAEITCADGIEITPPELPKPYYWVDLPEVMPAEDLTVLSARIADPEYTVRFFDGKALYAEARAPEGYPIAIPDAPEREGHTFLGWSNFSDIMPPYDFDAKATFEANAHTVSYIVMGEELIRLTVRYGEEIVPPAAPERSDGEFVEWIDLPETMPDEDLVIEARYSTPEFHVTYRLDGEVYYEADVALGRVLPKLNPPKRPGMTFEGWTNYTRVMPAYPIVISGRYVPTVRTLTYLSGGAVLAKREYRVGDPVVAIDGRNPLLGDFEGWFDLPAVMPDEDVTAVAKYSPKTYTVTYLLDGKPVASQTLAAGDPIKAPVAPSRENALFREWVDLPEVMPDSDLIVSGVYDPTVYTVTYRAGGAVVASEIYPIGARIRPIAAPMREHERFVTWRNFTETMPAYDFTVDAVYEPNLCSYSFVVDGEILLSGIMRAGDPILAPIPAEKVGLDFAGFDGYDGIMPSTDVVYVGRYEPKTYHVYYIVDGNIWRTDDYHEGDEVDLSVEAPTLPLGYEFSGWSAIPSVMPNHDVDVVGTTSPQSFTLTVMADERVVAEKLIPTNSLIARYSAPRRHGYTFRGWEGLPEFMPPSDITVNGTYEASEPEYVFCTLSGEIAAKRTCKAYYTPEKGKRIMKRGLYSNAIWLSGDRVEMVSAGRSYAADISAFVCDGEITDRTGLTRAIAGLAAVSSPKVSSYHLIVDNRKSVDGLFEFAISDQKELENLLSDRMLSDVEDITMPKFSYKIVSADEAEGTLQVAASVVDEEFFRTVYEVCRAAGLPVREPLTPQMSMVEYMQTRDIHGKGGSLVEILTGGYILLAVYVNGKLVCSVKNAIPFDLGYDAIESEIERCFAKIAAFLEEEDVSATLSSVFYGGFRVDRLKKLVKLTRRLTRAANRSPRCGLSARFTLRKPAGLEIACPCVKRRKKVKYPNDPAKNAKKK